MTASKPLKGSGILTPLQRKFLETFSTLADQDQFYLAGGTAHSEYYLGHRLSFDLDIFTGADDLVQPMSFKVEKICAENKLPIKVVRRFATFMEFLVGKGKTLFGFHYITFSPQRTRFALSKKLRALRGLRGKGLYEIRRRRKSRISFNAPSSEECAL